MIDTEIIEECRKGNLQNFKKIVEDSSPMIFSVSLRMLGDEESAMDVVQETMITVWKNIRKVKSAGSFKTWVYRIALNKCYDELRKRNRTPESVADEQVWKNLAGKLSENPGKEADNREIAVLINTLTRNLSPKQRAVFVMSDLEDLTGEEISVITGMSRMNIKANLYYARKKISEMIKAHM